MKCTIVLDDLQESSFDWKSIYFPKLQTFMAPFHYNRGKKWTKKLRASLPKTAQILFEGTELSAGVLEKRVALVRDSSYCLGSPKDIGKVDFHCKGFP